jgi:hypothetical protein
MGAITVINNTGGKVYAAVAVSSEDDSGSSSAFFTIESDGQEEWNRAGARTIFFTRSLDAGASVEAVLGIPDTPTVIN